ncbi:MAG: glycosyltransferase family 4 protein [Caldilineaceae bacterium]|nr:glycosyltransferase family 4 protein [Caldilineaceae bacterium]
MNVCLDVSPALGQSAGIGRYARELALALSKSKDIHLSLIHNRQPLHRLPQPLVHLQRSEIPLKDKAWRFFLLSGLPLPKAWGTTAYHCDIFHGTDVITPALPVPIAITVHDLTTKLFPQLHTLFHGRYQRLVLPMMLRRAAIILTNSESTRHDVLKYMNISSKKVVTTLLGVDHARFNPGDQKKIADRLLPFGITEPYWLTVGTLEPRKNLPRLLQAYAYLGKTAPPLVLAGAYGWHSSSIYQLVHQIGIEDRVIFPGFVPDELLPDLYRAAQLFIYPSLYEGFGLPILEAMACGTPVVTSNCSSMAEIAGDAAVLVDPTSEDNLVEVLHTLVSDRVIRETMSVRGILRAQQFSWENTTQATIAAYRQLLVTPPVL